MQAISILQVSSLFFRASFLFHIPSAFHWKMFSVFNCRGFPRSVASFLCSRLLTPQVEAEVPPVAKGGPIRGNGPGTPPAWRDPTGVAPWLIPTFRTDIEVCLRATIVFRFGLWACLGYLRLSAWWLRFQPVFLWGCTPLAFNLNRLSTRQ